MVIFNNESLSPEQVSSLLSNRGFLYGDGFFETIAIRNKGVLFLEGHMKRAQEAMRVLELEGASDWDADRLELKIQQLWRENGQPEDATVKWIVWRNSEGLYTPQQQQEFNYLLELKPFRSAPAVKEKTYLAKQVTNVASVYSSFKRLSALHYVIAGLEKTKREADELILLDHYGNLSEATSSSLFWIIKDVLYTPSLDTGCIAGVVRQYIMDTCINMKLPVEEVQESFDALTEDATVFTANIAGISLVESIDGRKFKNNHPCIGHLKHAIFSPSFSRSL